MPNQLTPGGCILTPIADAAGYWNASPGTLRLQLAAVAGTVAIDAAQSSVQDITDSSTPKTVAFQADATTFSFTPTAGRSYHISLPCTLLPSPYTAKATLQEPCGQAVATVNFLNPSPGLVVHA